jgi:hypothetical protein
LKETRVNDNSNRTDDSIDSPADTVGTSERQGNFKPLRVWPAVLLLVAMAATKFLPTFAEEESMALMVIMILGPVVCSLLILVWWLAGSRATAMERIVGLVGILCFAFLAAALADHTMRGPGMIVLLVPLGMAAFSLAAILFKQHLSFKRTIISLLVAACGFGFVALLRSDGMWGNGKLSLYWRWSESAEEKLVASRSTESNLASESISEQNFDSWLANSEWPQFRGSNGHSEHTGVKFSTDWSTKKPKLIWKVPIGPGWSSFVVAGNLLFTQEQLGEHEMVACYAADTGKEIWKQQIKARFFDPLGGPGPRATPTLADGKLFVQGADGLLQRLDPKTGEVVWSQDLKEVADRLPPTWGFSSSPLLIDSLVIVHAGGAEDKGIFAFNVEDGTVVWSAESGDHSYSTPNRVEIGGVEYVIMLTNAGLNVLDPLTGDSRLNYQWKYSGYRATQPRVVGNNSVLLPTQELGTRRIQITSASSATDSMSELIATEEWTSPHLKPDFNDFVVHEDHAFGFTGAIFTCVGLSDGKRKWKGGRYGKGQVFLLADSALLLVVSESGEILLVKADPESHQELAKFQALEGRTWNHPVVIGNRLYIRNSQEAACYELPVAEGNE